MLKRMFDQQRQFMDLLIKNREYPRYPIDATTKQGQKFCKSLVYEIMGELFEAVQLLKNSKQHRLTDIPDLDRDELRTELSDALHYFIELLIYIDVEPEALCQTFLEKGDVNIERITRGY